jgi:hypothetical protein
VNHLNPLFEADCSSVIYERREIWHPIEPVFAVQSDGLGLFHAGFQPESVIFELVGKPLEFIENPFGNSKPAFARENKHSLYFRDLFFHWDQGSATDRFTIGSHNQKNASRHGHQSRVKIANIRRWFVVPFPNLLDERGQKRLRLG